MPRIREVQISNILGTKNVGFKPGTLTALEGRNGDGKTSILEALKKVFEGGHDPNILRRGAKFGEVILTMDDNSVIRMRVTTKSTTYEVTDPNGNEVKAPRAYIEQLGEGLAVDPAKLLLAKPRELAGILLELMPIQFSQEELRQAVGEETWTVNQNMNLDQVDDLRKQIYEARTAANRSMRDADATVKSLRSSLPESDSGNTNWATRVKELRDLLEESKQSRTADVSAIDRDERDAIEYIKAEAQKKVDETRERFRQQRTQTDAEYEPQLLKIAAAVEEAEHRSREHDKAEGIRVSLARFEEDAKRCDRMSRSFTSAIESLEQLKQTKLANLPVPELEVREGEVFVDGIAFDRINLAERIKICFQIAALRSGKLPFMVLDQAEAFDSATWEAFKAGAAESGFQVIAARVADTPLQIEAMDGVLV